MEGGNVHGGWKIIKINKRVSTFIREMRVVKESEKQKVYMKHTTNSLVIAPLSRILAPIIWCSSCEIFKRKKIGQCEKQYGKKINIFENLQSLDWHFKVSSAIFLSLIIQLCNRYRIFPFTGKVQWRLQYKLGLNQTGHMNFLTGQDRTPKFAGQVLPDWTESGLNPDLYCWTFYLPRTGYQFS